MTDEASTSSFESRDKALKEGGAAPKANLVKMWLTAIAAAGKDESEWRKVGGDIIDIYRSDEKQKGQTAFNILYSNTETLLPAIYNSTPVPDIRRRYNDPGVVSKAVADILERAITYSIDVYDFDSTIKSAMFDAAVPGRGLVRVRYSPYVQGSEDHGAEGEGPESQVTENMEHSPEGENEPVEGGEQVTSHEVRCEYVPWKNFRRGPGLVWDDVDWIAFEHFLSREQFEQLDPAIGKAIALDSTVDGNKRDDEKTDNQATGEIFARGQCWEVWDRVKKQVLFVAPAWLDEPVKIADDPYKLTGFYPIPRPMQFVETPTNLVPVPPYQCYKALAEELNEVTTRIRKITRQLRVKGFYAAPADNLQEIVDADDGDLVAIPGLEAFMANGGIDGAIAWWPIEPSVKALAQLIEHREMVKATIYEVCGIADIMRGNTKATETASAQQIKSQWGSLRVQRAQAEVGRFIRDVFRIKAELISTFYDMPTLQQMTGVDLISAADKQLIQQRVQMLQTQAQQSAPAAGPVAGAGAAPPPAPAPIPPEITEKLELPTIEEVEQLLRSDLLRSYKVDVESDSTVRADLTRNQEQMNLFIQGTAQYIQAVAPAVQAQLMPPDVAVDIYAAFARHFKLGKQVEDSLDRMASNAKEQAQKPQQEKPDPEMLKAQAEMQAKQQDMQLRKQEMEMNLQFKQQEAQMDAQIAQQKAQADIQIAYAKANADIQVKSMMAEKQAEMQDNKNQIQVAQASQGMQQDAEMHEATVQQVRQGNMMAAEKHSVGMESAQAEADRADEKHKVGLEVTKAKAKQKPGGK
jgi:hypothetical protein